MKFVEIVQGLLNGKKYKPDDSIEGYEDSDYYIFITESPSDIYECICCKYYDDTEEDDPVEYVLTRKELELDMWEEC